MSVCLVSCQLGLPLDKLEGCFGVVMNYSIGGAATYLYNFLALTGLSLMAVLLSHEIKKDLFTIQQKIKIKKLLVPWH